METIIIIVDHGSRISESNRMFEEVARRFAGKYEIVEPAHMELAEPSIATAYAAAVARGALDKRAGHCVSSGYTWETYRGTAGSGTAAAAAQGVLRVTAIQRTVQECQLNF